MAQSHRLVAVQTLLEAVDSAAPDTYAEPQARRRLFDGLITKHELQDYKPHGKRQALTSSRYGELLKQVVASGESNIRDFCHRGSRALTDKYLARINYTRSPNEGPLGAVQSVGEKADENVQGPNYQPGNTVSGSSAVQNSNPVSDGARNAVVRKHGGTEASNTHLQSAQAFMEERPSPKIRLSKSKDQVSEVSNSQKQTAGHKRPRSDVESGAEFAGPSSKAARLDSDSPPETLSEISTPEGPSAATTSNGKRKRPQDDDAETTDRPSKIGRQTTDDIAPRPAKPSAKKLGKAPARSQNASAAAGSTRDDGKSRANLSAPPQGPVTGEKRNHGLLEDELTVDTRPSHPMIAVADATEARERAEKIARTGAYEPNPKRMRMRAIMEEDPFSPMGYNVTPLDTSDIIRHLGMIWHNIEISTMFILGGPDKYKYSPAQFMVDPQPQLEEIYSIVLGKEWRKQAAVENLARAMSGHQLIESCTAAAVYRDVYEKPAPWQGPRDVLENMQALGQIESFNEWLKLFPVTPGNEIYIQRAVWNMSQHQVRTEEFARRTLRPLAEDLAKKFWTTIQPQLLLFGFPRMAKPQAGGFYEERLTALVDIYQEALLLKAKIQAAPDHYSMHWVERGVEFDRTSMETLGGAEGRRIVGWCVSPRVTYRHLVSIEPRTVCDAKVFSYAVEDF